MLLIATRVVPGPDPVLGVVPLPIVVLFWVWVLVALGIWIGRLVRRVRRRGSASGAATGSAPGGSATPTPPSAPGSVPVAGWTSAPAAGVPLDLTSPPGDAGAAATGFAAPDAGSSPAPADPSMPFTGVAPASGPGGEGRAGLFAPGPGSADPGISDGGRPPGAGRPTVVEALQGIVMPCNLTPVVDGSVSIPNPFRVAFLTSDAAAPAVGAALGDELQRLGFTLTTPAATELLARKPGVELRVMLYPTAAAARRGIELLFPAAPADAVGVEFTT